MDIYQNLTENELKDIDVKSQLEHLIQIQETKESGCIFDKISSMDSRFYKTGELNGSNYVKTPLRTNQMSIIKNDVEYCFNWSTLSSLHPCNNDSLNRVSNYRQYFNELNIERFEYTIGLNIQYTSVVMIISLKN